MREGQNASINCLFHTQHTEFYNVAMVAVVQEFIAQYIILFVVLDLCTSQHHIRLKLYSDPVAILQKVS